MSFQRTAIMPDSSTKIPPSKPAIRFAPPSTLQRVFWSDATRKLVAMLVAGLAVSGAGRRLGYPAWVGAFGAAFAFLATSIKRDRRDEMGMIALGNIMFTYSWAALYIVLALVFSEASPTTYATVVGVWLALIPSELTWALVASFNAKRKQ